MIASVSPKGTVTVRSESDAKSWRTTVEVPPGRLALSTLPSDLERLPIANRFRDLLRDGIHRLKLVPAALAGASSPLLPRTLLPDGSNLARVIADLEKRDVRRHAAWLDQIREQLPEIRRVDVFERTEDRHLTLHVEDLSGSRFPAWRLSEGTLRLLALVLVPFAAEPGAVWLVEEPENGVDPQAMATIHEAFRSQGMAQTIAASHSPVLAGRAAPRELLCFSRAGNETVVRGEDHPSLEKNEPAGIFASVGP